VASLGAKAEQVPHNVNICLLARHIAIRVIHDPFRCSYSSSPVVAIVFNRGTRSGGICHNTRDAVHIERRIYPYIPYKHQIFAERVAAVRTEPVGHIVKDMRHTEVGYTVKEL
jgi:hypothetical protein